MFFKVSITTTAKQLSSLIGELRCKKIRFQTPKITIAKLLIGDESQQAYEMSQNERHTLPITNTKDVWLKLNTGTPQFIKIYVS